jgi:hypothetical protein
MNLHLSISVGCSVEQILDVPNCLFEVYKTKPLSGMISENTPFTIIGFNFNTALQCLMIWGTVRVEVIQGTHGQSSKHSKTCSV